MFNGVEGELMVWRGKIGFFRVLLLPGLSYVPVAQCLVMGGDLLYPTRKTGPRFYMDVALFFS